MNISNVLSSLESNGVSCELNELVRYRAIARRVNLAPLSKRVNSMAGSLSSKVKGRGMEFDEARHYQIGDDIRSIDWRVTARTGKTHTKLYREERERPVLVFVDLGPSMHFGTALLYKSVQALHAMALISFCALARGDKIGAMLYTGSNDIDIKPKSTSKHAMAMLNQAVLTQQSCITKLQNQNQKFQSIHDLDTHKDLHKEFYLANPITQLAKVARPGSLVYVISDFAMFDERSFSELGRLSRHCEIRPLRIFDPIEEQLPYCDLTENVLVSDGFNEKTLILGDKNQAEQYEIQSKNWFAYLKSSIAQMDGNLRQISSAMPVEDQFIASKQGLILGELA